MQFYVLKSDRSIKHLKVSSDIQSRLTSKFEFEKAIFLKDKEKISFNTEWKADSNELLQIQNYDLPDSIRSSVSSADQSLDMSREELEQGSLKAMFGADVDSNGSIKELIFKKIDKSMILNRNRISLSYDPRFDRETLTNSEEPTLIVPDNIAIVYEEDSLLFASRHIAGQILDLTELFDEASEEQMDLFFNNSPLSFDELSETKMLADSWCKRRISMILKEAAWEHASVSEICLWAEGCGVTLSISTDTQGHEKIDVPHTRAEFKDFIRVLNEDFFEAPFSKKKFLTNSKKPAESPPV